MMNQPKKFIMTPLHAFPGNCRLASGLFAQLAHTSPNNPKICIEVTKGTLMLKEKVMEVFEKFTYKMQKFKFEFWTYISRSSRSC